MLVPVSPVSLHNGWDTKAMGSQRGPSPAVPTVLREGSMAGAGGSGGDTWGHKRELKSRETGGDVRTHKRRHGKG